MTVASSEPSRATALGVSWDQPLRRPNGMLIGCAVMDIGVQKRSGPADVLRSGETGLPEIGPGDVPKRVHCAAVIRHVPPFFRGAAYIAALEGDPWRPQV